MSRHEFGLLSLLISVLASISSADNYFLLPGDAHDAFQNANLTHAPVYTLGVTQVFQWSVYDPVDLYLWQFGDTTHPELLGRTLTAHVYPFSSQE